MIAEAGGGEIEINPAKRILKAGGFLCGGVFTGTEKVRSGYGNGDCLLFDFKHRVFALADATERFPWASRDLLLRLAESLDRSGSPDTVEGWRALINDEVYSGQKFQHKTTFSCAALQQGKDGFGVVVAHGGDCAVTIVDSATGSEIFQTRRDMNFAGRSTSLDDVTGHRLEGRSLRVVLATDGFNDLLGLSAARSLLYGARDAFTAWPADRIFAGIHGVLDEHRGSVEYDDIGFMVLDPFSAGGIGQDRILIGGTRPHEETRFRRDPDAASKDRWIGRREWDGLADVFAGAGILVIKG